MILLRVMKIRQIMTLNFYPIFISLYQSVGRILDSGLRPEGAIGAYAPEGLRICCIALLCYFFN